MVNTVLVGFIFSLVIMFFNKNLALIFTSSSSVIQMVNDLAVMLAFTVLLNCIQPVLSGEGISNTPYNISTQLKFQFDIVAFAGICWSSGVAVGSGRQAVVAYINIGSYYLVGIPLGVLLGWLFPSNIVVSVPYPTLLQTRLKYSKPLLHKLK